MQLLNHLIYVRTFLRDTSSRTKSLLSCSIVRHKEAIYTLLRAFYLYSLSICSLQHYIFQPFQRKEHIENLYGKMCNKILQIEKRKILVRNSNSTKELDNTFHTVEPGITKRQCITLK